MRSLDPDFNYGEFALIPGLARRSGQALDRLKGGHEMTTSRTTKAPSKKVATVPRRSAEILQQPLQDPVDLEEMPAQPARAFDVHGETLVVLAPQSCLVELPDLVEERCRSALAFGQVRESNHVADGRAKLCLRDDLDRPLRHHEQLSPTRSPQRDTQLLKVDAGLHCGAPFVARSWNGTLPGHTRCVA